MAIVSISTQKVTYYDAEGWIYRAPVSTGVKGRETPAGVFALIEKDKDHHSTMYDDAWDAEPCSASPGHGIALHGGPLPGYAASHGCIRMPYGFAEKLFDKTEIGMRVIIAPNDYPAMLAACETLASELRAQPQNGQNAPRLPNRRLMDFPEIYMWGLERRLLDLIENYVGLPIRYHGADLRREVADGKLNDVRQWHIDAEDRRMFKCILYLNDVEEGGGPFMFLPRGVTIGRLGAFVTARASSPTMGCEPSSRKAGG